MYVTQQAVMEQCPTSLRIAQPQIIVPFNSLISSLSSQFCSPLLSLHGIEVSILFRALDFRGLLHAGHTTIPVNISSAHIQAHHAYALTTLVGCGMCSTMIWQHKFQ